MGSCPSHTPPARTNINLIPQPVQKPRMRVVQPELQTNQVQQAPPMQDQAVVWLLPPKERWPNFQMTSIDPDRYTVHMAPPSIQTRPAPGKKPSTREQPNQKDTSDRQWEKKIDSKIVDSAHVQSQLTANFHACFNLASSNNADVLLISLKDIHQQFDASVKHGLSEISVQADKKLLLIIEDTKHEKDRLLAYDKEIQMRQEELYQDWLQLYIIELNKWRSEELARLQKYLLADQQQIDDASKRRINRLNVQTNDLKTLIMQDEQAKILNKTEELTAKIFDMSQETGHQHLGSESKTELNLRIQANVGRIGPGFSCTNLPS